MPIDTDELRARRWPVSKAAEYAARCAALRGCNYIPRNCINPTQMWQELDRQVIDQELGWAAAIGLNSLRVFLQYLVYEAHPQGLLDRMEAFLDIAGSHGLSTMFVLMDDCWGPEPMLGKQPLPIPGVHNSGWTMSPGVTRRRPEHWPGLERYVRDVLRRFARDERVIAWDLYNEAEGKSRPLVEAAFAWAREVAPSQPLLTCWHAEDLVDIMTFHCYEDPAKPEVARELERLLLTGRPVVCTECLARTMGNTLERFLPVYAKARVGWYVWGLVSGATQTRFPWNWPAGGPEPYVWFHDLLYPDGMPYRQAEVDLIRSYAATGARGENGPGGWDR